MTYLTRGPQRKGLWAYAYHITLPVRDEHISLIQGLLDQGHAEASSSARTWAGRVEVEQPVTRILVVSDSAAQDQEVNRRLEGELKALHAVFEITAPVAVVDEDPPGPANAGT